MKIKFLQKGNLIEYTPIQTENSSFEERENEWPDLGYFSFFQEPESQPLSPTLDGVEQSLKSVKNGFKRRFIVDKPYTEEDIEVQESESEKAEREKITSNFKSARNTNKYNTFNSLNQKYGGNYKNIFDTLAFIESAYNMKAHHSGGASGYLQLMPKNITAYGTNKGIDTSDFMSNGAAQFKTAINLMSEMERALKKNKDVIEKGKEMGYDFDDLLVGAWFAGVGGITKFIKNGKNPNDGNLSLANYIKRYKYLKNAR